MPDQLSPRPATRPSLLQAAVEAHLLGEGWNYTVDQFPTGSTTTVRLWNKTLTFHLEYSTFEAQGRLLLQLVPTFVIPDKTRREVALLLNYLNAYLHCNTFHLVPGRAEVRLRICLTTDLDQRVDVENVVRMTDLAVTVATRFFPLIREVTLGTASADQMIPRLEAMVSQ